MSHKTLLLIYHTRIHTVMRYEIILWENSCYSTHIFQIKKRVRRIITDCGTRDSCRILLKKLIILPLTSQYILSLLIFGVNNREQLLINSEVHNINTRHSSNLHLHLANLDVYQNGVYYSGIKIFNSLPFNFKICSDNLWTLSDAL
jgi:hypothetical protein